MPCIQTCPGHTRQLFDLEALPRIAAWASGRVRHHEAEAIVVCGMSGLLLGGIVSLQTGVPLIAVRKATDIDANHVAVCTLLPQGTVRRWVWLDDLIDHGHTLKHVLTCLDQRRVQFDVPLVQDLWPVAALLYSTDHRTKQRAIRVDHQRLRDLDVDGYVQYPAFTRA